MRKSESQREAQAGRTKAAILASARRSFVELGYDGAGVRGIANGAGVTAMMVGRYFGSKEGLFAAVIDETMREPVILAQANLDRTDMARAFANSLVDVTRPGGPRLDGFMILLRSSGSSVASRIARERIAAIHHATATQAISGQHAAEKAAVFLALVAGVQLLRQMLELQPIAKADTNVLTSILTDVISALLTSVS